MIRLYGKPLTDAFLLPASSGCQLPIDIVLQSSDGKRFGAHTKYLGLFSEGFPSPNGDDSVAGAVVDANNETVVLEEDSTIVLLLLQFMHPQMPPDVYQLDPLTFMKLATAMEKYVIYSGMEICRLGMLYVPHIFLLSCTSSANWKDRNMCEQKPIEVLTYAARQGYPDLVKPAAFAALREGSSEATIVNIISATKNASVAIEWVSIAFHLTHLPVHFSFVSMI